MKIEHAAYQVEDARSMAKWYVEHLGFTVRRGSDTSPFMHFLADDSRTVMIEIYSFPNVATPDYRTQDPLVVHLALVSKDVAADRERLIAAGATAAGEMTTNDMGDQLAILHDPWGFAIQLVKRSQPMI